MCSRGSIVTIAAISEEGVGREVEGGKMSRPDSAALKDFWRAVFGAVRRARELRGGREVASYRVASLISKVRDELRAYDVYVSALLLFVASRIVVIVGIDFGKLDRKSVV